MQELLHAYIAVERWQTLDAALELVEACIPVVLPVEKDDVLAARSLAAAHPGLGARDALHLATCRRHRDRALKSFDRALTAAFERG